MSFHEIISIITLIYVIWLTFLVVLNEERRQKDKYGNNPYKRSNDELPMSKPKRFTYRDNSIR